MYPHTKYSQKPQSSFIFFPNRNAYKFISDLVLEHVRTFTVDSLKPTMREFFDVRFYTLDTLLNILNFTYIF